MVIDHEIEKDDGSMFARVFEIIDEAIVKEVTILRFRPTDIGLAVVRQVRDGILPPILLSKNMMHSVRIRLKIMGNLSIAERRCVQVGTLTRRIRGKSKDIRIISLPLPDGGEEIILDLENKFATVRVESE